ncbi:MAG: HEAT repeat domain-containing protein [Tepidisphaeraceae bacterium]
MRGVRRAILVAVVTASTLVSMPAALRTARSAADFETDRIIAEQTDTLNRTLTGPGTDPALRLDAARKLLALGRVEQRSALRSVLTNTDPANLPARLAVAVALSADTQPDPQFVDPLFALFDPQTPQPLLFAAADALGLYKSSPDVTSRLIDLTDAKRDASVRLGAVRALGYLAEKRVARQLVTLTTDPAPAVASAAISALKQFAPLGFDSAAEWSQWWISEQDTPDAAFRDEILAARAAQLDQVRRDTIDVSDELDRRLKDQYDRADREEKANLLRSYLTNRRDAVRISGARLYEALATTGDQPAAVSSLLPALLTDASPRVRYYAARTMRWLNDAAAFDALAGQLSIERDVDAKVEQIQAIATQKNLAAIGLLRSALEDSSSRVVLASISAISNLAPTMLAADSPDVADLANRIAGVFDTRTKPNQNVSLREASVAALASLRQPQHLLLFRNLLMAQATPEAVGIRRAAAIGLGNASDAKTLPLLIDALKDESPEVRLAAIGSISRVSRDSTAADNLLPLCSESREKDARVRDAAWKAIRELFKVMPETTLSVWPTRQSISDDPSRQIDVYQALLAKAEQAHHVEDQISRLQQIGDKQLELQRYADAVASFDQALDLALVERFGPACSPAGGRRIAGTHPHGQLRRCRYLRGRTAQGIDKLSRRPDAGREAGTAEDEAR